MLAHGLSLIGYSIEKQAVVKTRTKVRRFKGHYGSHPRVCAKLWETLQATEQADARVANATAKDLDNFLICLFFCKNYPLEETLASRFHIHEQTGRKWARHYVAKIAALLPTKVVWPEEWEATFIISVDCVNFGTNEPRHPTQHKQKKYFDRKGGKAGLTYEIALDLWRNRMVWFNGPFPPNDGGD